MTDIAFKECYGTLAEGPVFFSSRGSSDAEKRICTFAMLRENVELLPLLWGRLLPNFSRHHSTMTFQDDVSFPHIVTCSWKNVRLFVMSLNYYDKRFCLKM